VKGEQQEMKLIKAKARYTTVHAPPPVSPNFNIFTSICIKIFSFEVMTDRVGEETGRRMLYFRNTKQILTYFSLYNFIFQTDDLPFYEMTSVKIDNVERGDNLNNLILLFLKIH
jgi:hypothetical protein